MYKNGGKIPGGSIDLSPQTGYLGNMCHWQDSKGVKWWQDFKGNYGSHVSAVPTIPELYVGPYMWVPLGPKPLGMAQSTTRVRTSCRFGPYNITVLGHFKSP